MVSVSYGGKNAYSAGKTIRVLMGGASGAYRGYVLAHCATIPLMVTQHLKYGQTPSQVLSPSFQSMLTHYQTYGHKTYPG